MSWTNSPLLQHTHFTGLLIKCKALAIHVLPILRLITPVEIFRAMIIIVDGSDGWYWLSTWQNLESLRRQTSAHTSEGSTRLEMSLVILEDVVSYTDWGRRPTVRAGGASQLQQPSYGQSFLMSSSTPCCLCCSPWLTWGLSFSSLPTWTKG